MPETRVERVIFALGVVVVAGLVVLIVAGRKEDAGADHRAVTTVRRTLPVPPASSVPPRPPASAPTTAAATSAETHPGAPRSFTLTLAARVDSWFEIRSDSATGEVLYSGVLQLGQRRTFTGTRLWARFGGAANLDARLNGRPLELPPGTYSAIVTRTGLAARPGGE